MYIVTPPPAKLNAYYIYNRLQFGGWGFTLENNAQNKSRVNMVERNEEIKKLIKNFHSSAVITTMVILLYYGFITTEYQSISYTHRYQFDNYYEYIRVKW